ILISLAWLLLSPPHGRIAMTDDQSSAIPPPMVDLSPETEALARKLAKAQRISLDDAVRQAAGNGPLPGRRPRDPSPVAVAARRKRIDRIAREVAAMPILDPRSPREIMEDLNT